MRRFANTLIFFLYLLNKLDLYVNKMLRSNSYPPFLIGKLFYSRSLGSLYIFINRYHNFINFSRETLKACTFANMFNYKFLFDVLFLLLNDIAYFYLSLFSRIGAPSVTEPSKYVVELLMLDL